MDKQKDDFKANNQQGEEYPLLRNKMNMYYQLIIDILLIVL